MSQTSLKQDACSYTEQLRRSIGPGMYMLSVPANDCGPCGKDIPADPSLRYQAWGPGFCKPGSAVDVGSELLGLNYKASKCSREQFVPGKYDGPAQGACTPAGTQPARKCMAPTESTRLSNPPCTLRGTGWNRWEWLCYDPQDKAIVPFEWNTSYRTVVKDNHKPCIPTLMDQSSLLPPAINNLADPADNTYFWAPPKGCGAEAPGNPLAPTYTSCEKLKRL